jgi:transcription elongation GreA/GreB family factor
MTQGPPGGEGREGYGGPFGRRERRVALLARASQAIRNAHTVAEQAGITRAAAEEAHLTALENQALRVAERDALRELETDVRQFAGRLREAGTPPEIAVRRLKATVDPVVFSNRDHDGADVDWRRAVAGDVVRWFVEAYYAA